MLKRIGLATVAILLSLAGCDGSESSNNGLDNKALLAKTEGVNSLYVSEDHKLEYDSSYVDRIDDKDVLISDYIWRFDETSNAFRETAPPGPLNWNAIVLDSAKGEWVSRGAGEYITYAVNADRSIELSGPTVGSSVTFEVQDLAGRSIKEIVPAEFLKGTHLVVNENARFSPGSRKLLVRAKEKPGYTLYGSVSGITATSLEELYADLVGGGSYRFFAMPSGSEFYEYVATYKSGTENAGLLNLSRGGVAVADALYEKKQFGHTSVLVVSLAGSDGASAYHHIVSAFNGSLYHGRANFAEHASDSGAEIIINNKAIEDLAKSLSYKP